MRAADLQAIRIKVASPEEILAWSHGEVKKPETINYRTQRPEKDGLFCEKIFGPTKDFECYCSKYKGVRFKGTTCDRCGVEVIKSAVRRERMGHITLAVPVSHIWFLRGVPSRIGMILGLPSQTLEKVIYFAAYIIIRVDQQGKARLLGELDEEFKKKSQGFKKQTAKQTKTSNLELENLKNNYLIRKQEILSLEPLSILSEAQYREFIARYGEIFEAGTGAETIRTIFEKIDFKKEITVLRERAEGKTGTQRKKTLMALRLFEGMQKAGLRPEWMIMSVLPVLPPDLRPMVQLDGGRYASSDLNDLYRRVINRNNRLKYLLEISAPDVIIRNEKRMLQEAVDALLDNKMRKSQMVTAATTGGKRVLKSLADILGGKQGRFRKNLLGKRVDYSGRSVIVPGSEFQLFQCGIPKIMALELFRPFVIKKLLEKGLVYNIRGATRLIEEGLDDVWACLEEVVEGKLVLLNRAPTLHRLGIQAFEPKLIEGEAIKLHPMVCAAFNADFDGDQMAVHVPLSEDAQKEAVDLMWSAKNILKPADGLPIVTPAKDMILGCYYLTGVQESGLGEGMAFSSPQEAILVHQMGSLDLRSLIKVRWTDDKSKEQKLLETTCGRLIFNQALPANFPFFNEQATSKKISKILSRIVESYSLEETQRTLDKIKDIGFEYATQSGVSWGMDDLIVPAAKKDLMKAAEAEVAKIEQNYKKGFLSRQEKGSKLIGIWQEVKAKIEKMIPDTLPKDGPVFTMINSGARGSWAQPVQMAGMKGLVTSPSGRIIEMPIKHSFKEGFGILEYFISTHGARKGTSDTALRTSASGYLTRRLVDVVHEMIIADKDCHSQDGLEVLRKEASDIGQDFRFKIVGRVVLENVKNSETKQVIVKRGEIINWQVANMIDELKIEKIKVRSPLTCKNSRRVCQMCYGWDMGRNTLVRLGEAVGIVAAQSIGEPGTQLTMRTFHTGGVSSASDITRGLPRIEEIFEARIPKGEGTLTLNKGKVTEVDLEKGIIKIEVIGKKDNQTSKKKSKDGDVIEYRIPLETDVYVKKGDVVEPGQALCQGSLDLKKLFKTTGLLATQRYILREIQRIYTSEGINIHDKHIEIVVKQMFSRLRIVDPGDGPWVIGQIVSLVEFDEVQNALLKNKKKPAKSRRIILGISRVALTSDSFLSAASFQETSRILIKSALEGREDHLNGLKENVMIGRLIPAGTGFRG
ncbi:DNA-directed RNA polymerase subunit beta' [bacterium (Candidatus Gribaldobacteria) CG08_land_8_20_14_0_20_39_15]|uniref:DNA-directed RNA polymerase subunit beta' n=1 Tax=bacterium (Candidatus Gribaldobacteria) CG08_land_8_20_14_0_20_39_15 TaxID=2014273 RepID=A0A2M6XV56_9BACT|nr:MAG: DNA-directed RNA polymerase subunit beta' [bacterium (Candidatus Gribaldobacteria) CG08_land_8_20_14_0_20_39_15]